MILCLTCNLCQISFGICNEKHVIINNKSQDLICIPIDTLFEFVNKQFLC